MLLRKTILNPIQELARDGRLTGILLLLMTALSLTLSNSPLGHQYLEFWHIEFGPHFFHESIVHWINDGLMAIFFFLVGMEIKRELLIGQLSDRKKALLPALAAAGGMLMPALIYVMFNINSSYLEGWAIPTATDIAFSLGVLSLVGKKVPMPLKVFLTALAIIDDLGAVLIIAIFYTSELHFTYLFLAALCFGILLLMNRMKVNHFIFYLPLGLLLWFFVFESGVHATVAGVLFAMSMPITLIEKLEHALHRPVNFGIMPVFALANTAIMLPTENLAALISPLSGGILFGLLFGKPIGIFIASFLAVKYNLAKRPSMVSWTQVFGVACTAGIGFTMSIFIAGLSFNDVFLLDEAKLSVLSGSILAALAGLLILTLYSQQHKK
ncbi:MAG: Na+/H+ antiporter NhaA [Bacteroidetes bacterium]|nr:Na+/H+ antiporter NhaA [Bacteroidota bacterium]